MVILWRSMAIRSKEQIEQLIEECKLRQLEKKEKHKQLMKIKYKNYQKEYRIKRKQYLKDFERV